MSAIDKGNLFLFEEVNDQSALRLIKCIQYLNTKTKLKEIKLFINSSGGDSHAGFSLIAVIKRSKKPVTGIVLGTAQSAALDIFVSTHKRLVSEYAIFMTHEHTINCSDASHTEIKSLSGMSRDMSTMARQLYSDRCKIDGVNYQEFFGTVPRYFDGDKAIEMGFADGKWK